MERELETKIKHMLKHEVNMEQELVKLHKEMEDLVREEEKAIWKLEWNQFHNNMYWLQKSRQI